MELVDLFMDETVQASKQDKLAQQLKQICDEDGKEKNVRNSALLLHSLGKEYQSETPDMFSLIRSAALYNAAILRRPYNVDEIENDLKQLCKLVLQEAKAKIQNADLIAKSKEVKQNITTWRDETEKQLLTQQKISATVPVNELRRLETAKIHDMRRIQEQITQDYIRIIADIAAFCEQVMGEAPFVFAIAGMGSLAKKEATPFSDFEHIILLSKSAKKVGRSYEKKLNYYRWFSVIFHIVVINLQETILPSVAINCLNNDFSNLGNWFYDGFTTRGISFDGMMVHACKFPLGLQEPPNTKPWKRELIKPVDEMLSYLSVTANLKNGYRLSDVLTKTCFVYKDKEIFDEFHHGVAQKQKYDIENGDAEKSIKSELAEDLSKFSVRTSLSKLKREENLNVKRIVYRSSSLFISALGKINKVYAESSFEIIEELARKKVLSKDIEHMLMYAVAIACEIRLRWYFENKQQCDEIKTNASSMLLSMVGEASTKKFFLIAYALQCDLAKRIKLKKKYFYSNPHLFCLAVDQCFAEYQRLRNFPLDSSNITVSNERFYSFDDCLQAMELSHVSESCNRLLHENNVKNIQDFAIKLFRSGLYDDALECFDLAMRLRNVLPPSEQTPGQNELREVQNTAVGENYFFMGQCMRALGNEENAFQYFEKSMQIFQQEMADSTNAQHWIGRCLLQTKNHQQAFKLFTKCLKITKEHSVDVNADNEIAVRNYWVGVCLVKMNNFSEATRYFEKSLQAKKNLPEDAACNGMPAILFWYGKAVYRSKLDLRNKDIKAFKYFKRSLEIIKKTAIGGISNTQVAKTLFWLGLCLERLKNYDEALIYFAEAFEIRKKIAIDAVKDKRVAKAQFKLGECLLHVNRAEEAITHLENLMKITEVIYPDVIFDLGFFRIHTLYYQCCFQLNKLDNAIIRFESLLKVEEKKSLHIGKDLAIALTLDFITRCYLDVKKTNEATKYLIRALTIHCQHDTSLSRKIRKTSLWCVRHLKGIQVIDSYRKRCSTSFLLTSQTKRCMNFGTGIVLFFVLSFAIFILCFFPVFTSTYRNVIQPVVANCTSQT